MKSLPVVAYSFLVVNDMFFLNRIKYSEHFALFFTQNKRTLYDKQTIHSSLFTIH